MIFWSSYDWMLSCLRNKEQKNENKKKIGRISQILKILLEIKLIEIAHFKTNFGLHKLLFLIVTHSYSLYKYVFVFFFCWYHSIYKVCNFEFEKKSEITFDDD